MSKLDKLERDYALAKEVSERLETLRQKQPEYFSDRQKIFEAFEQLQKQFLAHLDEDKRFLEGLPGKIKERVEKDKAVLELKKQILELLKVPE